MKKYAGTKRHFCLWSISSDFLAFICHWLGYYSFTKHGLAACLKLFCPNLTVKSWEKYVKYLRIKNIWLLCFYFPFFHQLSVIFAPDESRIKTRFEKIHDREWFVMICHKLSWIVINCHGLSWFVMNCHKLSWIVMHCHEFSWVVMNSHECSWILMNSHEFAWIGIN